MYKTTQKWFAATLSLTLFMLPVLVQAAGLIPCDGPSCGFSDLIKLTNNVIKFLLFAVAVPLAALGFMWAGGSLVLSQNKEGAWTEAKGRFENIGYGFAIMLGAYVLIKVIIYQFLNTDAGFFTFLAQ